MKQPQQTRSISEINTLDALMAFSWILLFGGRWIAGNFLVGFGVVSLSLLDEWDNTILERTYLILFAITIIIGCLRRLRKESDPS